MLMNRPLEEDAMRKEDMYKFLIRSAIPEVVESWKIPEDDDLAGYFPFVETPDGHEKKPKTNLIWDAVWSAHGHVIPGSDETVQLYYGIGRKGEPIEPRRFLYTIPGMARELFVLIMKSNRPLNSKDLIFKLYEVFPEPEEKPRRGMTRFGVIQLLVNWTLKNLLILKTFGCVGLEDIEIDEEGCDCPLDPVTCMAMGGGKDDWMYLTPKNYRETQRAIRQSLFLDSGVVYDFLVRHPSKLFADD